jgi:hypothetical protein
MLAGKKIVFAPRQATTQRVFHVSQREFTKMLLEIERSYEDGYDMAILFEFDREVQIEKSVWAQEFDNRMAARGRTQRFALVARETWRPRFNSFSQFVSAFGTETRMFSADHLSEAREWVASS